MGTLYKQGHIGRIVEEVRNMIARILGTLSIVFLVLFSFATWVSSPASTALAQEVSAASLTEGRATFRFDTFGNEQLWTDVLRMHQAVARVSPTTALSVGLKVDVKALPAALQEALKAGKVDLTDPAVTVELIRLNAVVGVIGRVNSSRRITKLGITCALCHSTVDNSFARGIGRRLDGWANTQLNVGAILALSPALDDALKAELRRWGPGKYDPRHHIFDGDRLRILNTPSLPVVIPPAYGLKGVGFETYTGDGPISYWNSYVAVSQMGGHGTFRDRRIRVFIEQSPDRVTPKLPALLAYQLSLQAPKPREGSFDPIAAARGERLFNGRARCETCHSGETYTDVGNGRRPVLHDADETGMDPRYARRSATRQYRTTPLRALRQHPPYFHDGSARTLLAVVNHYNTVLKLNLTEAQKADLVEFLKSL
jgi:hypothetical protein